MVYHIHEEDKCWYPLLPETQARVICYCITGDFLLNNLGLHARRLCSAYCLVYCHSELHMVVVSQCGDLPGDNISKGSHCTHIPVCYCSWRMRGGASYIPYPPIGTCIHVTNSWRGREGMLLLWWVMSYNKSSRTSWKQPHFQKDEHQTIQIHEQCVNLHIRIVSVGSGSCFCFIHRG